MIAFTEHFPWGLGERWKQHDLSAMAPYFDTVKVVPYRRAETAPPALDLPSNVRIEKGLMGPEDRPRRPWIDGLTTVVGHPLWRQETLAQCMSLKRGRVVSCLGTVLQMHAALRECERRKIFGTNEKSTTLFFFWGAGAASMLPLLKGRFARTIVCLHGYDLYEERTGFGYFPFRRAMFDTVDVLAPCSEHGARHIRNSYPEFSDKIKVKRIGVEDFGIGVKSPTALINVISCSMVHAVKRLERLVDALSLVSVEARWTHLGGGSELKGLVKYAEEQLSETKVTTHFTGTMSGSDVKRFLVQNPVDLLLNVSSSEGVPVSMMEALSAGVPVAGTNVGGVHEIIDDKVGYLMPADASPSEIAEVVERHASRSVDEIAALRRNARQRVEDMCRAPELSERFAEELFGDTVDRTDVIS